MRTQLALSVLALHAAACGDSAPRCPTGTVSENGVCVAATDGEVEIDTNEAGSIEPTADANGDPPFQEAPLSDAGREDADVAATCYVDDDGDGYGAGTVAVCTDSTARQTGDCDDKSPTAYPGAPETCDKVDNDCDGKVDNEAVNACGGACSAVLPHAPGETCNNGLLGACSRDGAYACSGTDAVSCNAPAPAPSAEICDDNVDNDCNGRIDEPTAQNALTWYQDCDGDGYAAFTQGSVRGCTKPANVGGCAWTSVIPNAETRTNWDCDDSNSSYSPKASAGSPNGGNTSWDLDCNGKATEDSRSQNLNSPLAIQLSGSQLPKVCNTTAIGTLNSGLCNNIPLSANVPCVTWRRTTGLYSTYPDVFCPDAPVLFRGEGSGPGGCELIALPFAYLCK